MANLGENANTGDVWVDSRWTIYHRLTATVSRSGDTVSLTNITAYFHLEGSSGYAYAGTNYNPAYFYLQKGGTTISTSASQTWNWSVSAPYSGDVATFSLPNCSFNVGTSVTSATIDLQWQGMGNDHNTTSWTISFPSGTTPPSGGSITNVSTTTDSITATVSLTSWGTGTSGKLLRLAVLENGHYITTSGEPQYATSSTDGNLTATLTVDNNSTTYNNPSWTIQPGTQYDIGIYAETADGSYRFDYPSNPVTTASNSGKLYGSVNGETELIEKLYGPVNYLNSATLTVTSDTNNMITAIDKNTFFAQVKAEHPEFLFEEKMSWGRVDIRLALSTVGGFQLAFREPASGGVTKYYILATGTRSAIEAYGITLSSSTIPDNSYAYIALSDYRWGKATKKIEKLYGSVNGQTKLVYKG